MPKHSKKKKKQKSPASGMSSEENNTDNQESEENSPKVDTMLARPDTASSVGRKLDELFEVRPFNCF